MTAKNDRKMTVKTGNFLSFRWNQNGLRHWTSCTQVNLRHICKKLTAYEHPSGLQWEVVDNNIRRTRRHDCKADDRKFITTPSINRCLLAQPIHQTFFIPVAACQLSC